VDESPTIIVGNTLAGRYEVERELGHGGTSIVYLARDLSQGRMVAIKALRLDLAETLIAPRFLREIRLTAALHHPHIVPLLDSGEADGVLYCVMPYMEGGTLRDRLVQERQLPLDEAVVIARTIAGALDAAHGKGLIHRDVKPANILFAGGQACLGDFGIARALARGSGDDSTTTTGLVRGTPAYMSPEQAAGNQHYDGRSDIYSLGCVLYEMIAGVQPYVGPTSESVLAQRMVHPPQPLKLYRPSVPPQLAQVVERALMTGAADRYQTAAEFEDALAEAEPLLPRGRTTSHRIPAAGRDARRSRRRWVIGTTLVAAVAAGVVVGQRILNPPEPIDDNRLVVAPFDVLGADTTWKVGFVDILSRNFDGAGPLHTVSASATMQSWKGIRSDAGSATQLARHTRARLAVYGQLVRAGRDSLLLAASLIDVVSGKSFDVEVRDDALQMVRITDSVTVRLLRELGRFRPIAAVARASMGSRSFAALKSFLQGEQFYRANNVQAAREAYESAIGSDPNFALAYRRMRGVLRVIGQENDSASFAFARRAGELNHGLAPRDSLLIVADSLAAAKPPGSVFLDNLGLRQLRRRVAALEAARRQYTDDAEVQFEFGEAAYHIGERVGLSQDIALGAFLRSIELDSRFLPSYWHAIELSLPLDGPAEALRLASQCDALNPREQRYQLFRELLQARRPQELARIVATTDKLPVPVVEEAIELTWRWPDSLATGVQLARGLLQRSNVSPNDSATGNHWWVATNLYRGRLAEARKALTTEANLLNVKVASELALLGVMRPDSALRIAEEFAASDSRGLYLQIPLFRMMKDSVSLARLIVRFQSDLDDGRRKPDQPTALIGLRSAKAHLTLLRGDTAKAANEFQEIPDSLCSWWCGEDRLVTAQLLRATGKPGDALKALDRHPPGAGPLTITEPLWRLEHARSVGQTNRALADEDFKSVRLTWSQADSSLLKRLAPGTGSRTP